MMLDYLGENAAAKAVENAVAKVLLEGKTLTGDLGGNATLDQITNAIINSIKYGGK
jgi:isocitrate dehydrogenase (NAD+)